MTQRRTPPGAQDQFAVNLIAGMSVEDAAEDAGFSKNTGYNLLKDEAFNERLEDLRERVRAAIADNIAVDLTEAAREAVEALRGVMNGPTMFSDIRAADRIKAAEVLLTLAGFGSGD